MAIWRRENIHQHVNGTAPKNDVDAYAQTVVSAQVNYLKYWLDNSTSIVSAAKQVLAHRLDLKN